MDELHRWTRDVTAWALLSDVHGNLEALEAVLRDVEKRGVDRIAVLGDNVDYGPDPVACLERIVDVADVWLVGNHEQEVLDPSPDAEPMWRPIAEWTATQLEGNEAWRKAMKRVDNEGWDGAAQWEGDGVHFSHASPSAPIAQYVWPAHEFQYVVFNDQIDERLVEFLEEFRQPHGFLGHTHVPAVLTDQANHKLFDPYARECEHNSRFTFVGRRALFYVPLRQAVIDGLHGKRFVANPGSVGFPRRLGVVGASYAIYDGDRLELLRVEYDRDKTLEKLAGLPVPKEVLDLLVERLQTGV